MTQVLKSFSLKQLFRDTPSQLCSTVQMGAIGKTTLVGWNVVMSAPRGMDSLAQQ
jgi:hypothetical protein